MSYFVLCSSLFLGSAVVGVGSQGLGAVVRGVVGGLFGLFSGKMEPPGETDRALALELASRLSAGDYKLYEIGSRQTHFYVLHHQKTTTTIEEDPPPVFL